MMTLLQINGQKDSRKDENLKYLEEFSNKEFNLQSGLIFVDRKEFELSEKEALGKMHDLKNQSWGILDAEVNSMITEKQRLISKFKAFYNSKISELPELRNLNIGQLETIVSNLMIRIKRLDCVLDTKFNSTQFLEKKTGHRYLMAKGFWINNDGTRVRSISRNIANVESSITELVMKILKMNNKSIIVMELNKASEYKPDFLVYDGSKEWWVEIKSKNMDNMVKSFIMFETWKIYKNEYELLT
ncbi:MAG: hypothetical protein RBT49_11805 [Bacteroidales bacterium]|jgi:hypothetical protein|nr:hypothetical protein [Bacteroidales bacterium]